MRLHSSGLGGLPYPPYIKNNLTNFREVPRER
jgi:hypothetical protein